jgi:cyanophycinase
MTSGFVREAVNLAQESPMTATKKVRLRVELLETRATPSANPGYDYSRLAVDKKNGSSDMVVAPSALTGGLALEGGGTDIAAVYQWMANHGGNGDFLMIGSATSTSGNYYNNPVKSLLGSTKINSISTLMVSTTAAANSTFVTDTISKAEAIFILGGDQSTYVNLWAGTKMITAINAAQKSGVPIGGTSAGLAVLSQYSYSAQYATSAVSSTVLQNPYDPSVTIVNGFLQMPYLDNTIVDPHFYERDRMGRLVTFMARVAQDNHLTTPVKGIGIDEQTALLIETQGAAAGTSTVVANATTDPNTRHVYFVETVGLPTQCAPGQPLIDSGILVHRASVGDASIVVKPSDPTTSTISIWDSMQTSPKGTASDYLLDTYVTATGTVLKKRNSIWPDAFVY